MPNSPSAGSFGGYSNPKFDSLVEQARSSVDVDRRKQLLDEAQRVFAQDAPAQVLFYPDGDYAYRTAAYTGWVADTGHGIFTKRSFIPGYESKDRPAVVGGGSQSSPPWAAIVIVLAVAAVGGGLLIARSRRRCELEPEEA